MGGMWGPGELKGQPVQTLSPPTLRTEGCCDQAPASRTQCLLSTVLGMLCEPGRHETWAAFSAAQTWGPTW